MRIKKLIARCMVLLIVSPIVSALAASAYIGTNIDKKAYNVTCNRNSVKFNATDNKKFASLWAGAKCDDATTDTKE